MKIILAAALLLFSLLPAQAQQWIQFSSCGTAPRMLKPGAVAVVGVDLNGSLCIAGSISTSITFPTIGDAVPATGIYNALDVAGTLRGLSGLSTGALFPAAVAIVDASGTQITTFGSSAAVGSTGAAIPSSASLNGLSVGGTLRGGTALALGATFSQTVAIVDASGTQITSFGSAANVGTTGAAVPASAGYIGVNVGGNLVGLAPGTAGTASTQVLTVQGPTAAVVTMNSASANNGVTSAAAGVFDDAAPTSITENSFGFLRMSANRSLYAQLRDPTGEVGAAVKAASTAPAATDPALVVALSPNNAAITTAGADGVSNTLTGLQTYARTQCWNGATWDRCGQVTTGTAGAPAAQVVTVQGVTSGTSVPVVNGASVYETVAASQTAQVLGGSGAVGDYLSHCVVVPATTTPGVVTIIDNATTIVGFPGGASSVSNLVPFTITVGALSSSGAWKVTTGANVSVACVGKFT